LQSFRPYLAVARSNQQEGAFQLLPNRHQEQQDEGMYDPHDRDIREALVVRQR